MKNMLSVMALSMALIVGVSAEAGSIPTNKVPLKTYAIKKVNCYLQPNGTQKGWIDPGDYVIVTQIRSDGWAYGSYPVGRNRASRWFRANDLVNNVGFTNQERYSPKANTATYTNPSYNKTFGSFNDNEPITVVSDSGQSRQIIYKLNSGGYKMAWVPYWDCWSAEQAGKISSSNNNISYGVISGINAAGNMNISSIQNKINSMYNNKSYSSYRSNCFMFANSVFKELFGASVEGLTKTDNTYVERLYNCREFRQAYDGHYRKNGNYKVGLSLDSSYTNRVKEAFLAAKPGYFVQTASRKRTNSTGDCGRPHSAIIYKIESDGVTFYEANWTAGTITLGRKMSWYNFADWNIGFTIYAPNTYKLK